MLPSSNVDVFVAGLDRNRFYWTWFELADLYTTSIEAEDYVNFLGSMLEKIVRLEADGTTEWKEDRVIIEEFFESRRRQGKGFDVTTTQPVVLTRWHASIQAEVR